MAADWRNLELHPLAKAFPEMPAEEYAALKEDIRQNGLREPILLLFEGKILDGRHRHRACRELDEAGELKAEPETRLFKGSRQEALQHITSSNLMRRHLSKSQGAMFLVDSGLVPPPGKAGKRRKYGTGRNRITEIGKRYGVSHVTLYKAAYIHDQDGDLAARVLEGELSIAKAEAELTARALSDQGRLVDADGKSVPNRLESVFATREVFQTIESRFRSVEGMLGKILRRGLPDAQLKQAVGALERAQSALKRAKPHLICRICRGKGCASCANRGWLAEGR